MNFTEQFWRGKFGDEYHQRSPGNIEANTAFMAKIFAKAPANSVLEFGAGTGANLDAIRSLMPDAKLTAVEINEEACRDLDHVADVVVCGSALTTRLSDGRYADMVLTKGFLIHVPPESLDKMYENIFYHAIRWIVIAEYFNPVPVEVAYRGEAGVMWKRDFAADMMKKYPLRLLDYGFIYHLDPFPQDNLTWFLLEKC